MQRTRKAYHEMRGDCSFADRDLKGHQVTHMAKMLSTCCENHIATNLYRRVRRWLEYKVEKIAPHLDSTMRKEVVKQIIDDISGKEEFIASNQRVRSFVTRIRDLIKDVPGAPYRLAPSNIRRHWPKWLPLLWEIGKDFAAAVAGAAAGAERMPRGVRCFSLLPHASAVAHHIIIDKKTTMFQLLQLAGLEPRGKLAKDFTEAEAEEWHRKLFNFSEKETVNHKYSFSLRTDGVSVSILMTRPARAPSTTSSSTTADSNSSEVDVNPKEAEFQGGLDIEDSIVYGLDPGRRTLFTAVGTDGKAKSCRNREYRERTEVKKRQQQVENWLRKADLKTFVDEMPSRKVMTSALMEDHIRYLFRDGRIDDLFAFYGSVRYCKLRQNKYYCKERALEAMVERITEGRKNIIIAFGSANVGSCVRGNPPIAAKAFRRHCQKRCKVVLIDEYLTSQVCSKCGKRNLRPMRYMKWVEEAKEARSHNIWAVQVCRDCGTVWNRDVNASNNILAIFKSLNSNGERPPQFRRPTGTTGDGSASDTSSRTPPPEPPPAQAQ